MNRIYSLVWNEAQQRYMVAHEKAHRRGKPAAHLGAIGAAVAAACLALTAGEAVAQASSCSSNPIAGSVAGPCSLPSGGLTVGSSGTISNGSTGILVAGTSAGSLVNSGAIYGNYTSIYINNPSTVADGIRNNGTLYGSRYAGIGIANRASVTGGISNSGTIYGGGGLGRGISITSRATASGSITNASGGTISGNIIGIGLWGNSTVTGGITNASGGTITGGHTGIGLTSGSAIAGGLTNSGTIFGGNYAVQVDSSSLDSIHIAGNDTAVFVGTVSAPNTPVTVDSGATYTMNAGQQFTVSNFTNAGTLQIDAGNTGTISGNFTNSGTYSPTVASSTSYGKLTVSGTASLSGTLYINVTGTGSSLTVGNTLSSIIHAGSISGQFATVADNSTLFDFTASYTGLNGAACNGSTCTDVNLTAVAAVTAASATLANGNTSGLGAARTLDLILTASPSGPIATLFQGITGGTGAVSNAVSQTLPLLIGGTAPATQNALTGIGRIVQARQDANRGLSSGDDFYGDKTVWMKPFGSWAKQDDRDAVSGYKANTAGLIFGADIAPGKDSRVGIALAYANAHVTGNSAVVPSSASIDLYQLIGYGSYSLDASTELNYQADIGNNRNQGNRSIPFAGLTASSSYDSRTAHVGVGLERRYPFDARTSLTPSIRVDYTTIRDRAYSETGAGALNLNVAATTTNQLLYSTEVKLGYQLDDATHLFGSLGAGYDARAKATSVTAAYAGASGLSFTTTGAPPEHWLARGGLGVTSTIKNGPEVTARYDIEHRTGFNDQTVSAKVRWAF